MTHDYIDLTREAFNSKWSQYCENTFDKRVDLWKCNCEGATVYGNNVTLREECEECVRIKSKVIRPLPVPEQICSNGKLNATLVTWSRSSISSYTPDTPAYDAAQWLCEEEDKGRRLNPGGSCDGSNLRRYRAIYDTDHSEGTIIYHNHGWWDVGYCWGWDRPGVNTCTDNKSYGSTCERPRITGPWKGSDALWIFKCPNPEHYTHFHGTLTGQVIFSASTIYGTFGCSSSSLADGRMRLTGDGDNCFARIKDWHNPVNVSRPAVTLNLCSYLGGSHADCAGWRT